jgi:SAM-dependent methyltransferase
MPAIHAAASKGYETAAGTYVSGRPGYPPEVVDWLRETVGLGPGRTVLDLGSGTGKFLPYLRDTGARLIAVEPVTAMREQLTARNADVTALSGAADQIPLPDGSVDAVVCAQAFHWFADTAALEEIRRVLVPGGVLALVWNVRDERVDWVADLTRLVDRHEGDAPRYRTGDWKRVFPAEGFTDLGERRFTNAHVGPPERVIVDRTLSVSFIAALPPEERAKVADAVRDLIAATPSLSGRKEVSYPYVTVVYAYRKTG